MRLECAPLRPDQTPSISSDRAVRKHLPPKSSFCGLVKYPPTGLRLAILVSSSYSHGPIQTSSEPVLQSGAMDLIGGVIPVSKSSTPRIHSLTPARVMNSPCASSAAERKSVV